MELRQTGSCIPHSQRFQAASMNAEPVLCLVPIQLLGRQSQIQSKTVPAVLAPPAL